MKKKGVAERVTTVAVVLCLRIGIYILRKKFNDLSTQLFLTNHGYHKKAHI